MVHSEFAFVACQHGAERALKGEAARRYPAWRAAYQRPGLLTFRCPARLGVDAPIELVLARVAGLSLGPAANLDAACERIASLPRPLRLHVFERELYRPDEAPPHYVEGVLAAQVADELRARLPGAFFDEVTAEAGDLVLDVVVAPDEPWLLGVHRHAHARSALPGGRYAYETLPDAPSRAYRKIEEAIAAFRLPMRAGDVALELGAAPGGAAYALVRRGLSVIAVDPAELDARVLSLVGPGGARVTHLRMPMAEVSRAHLPAAVHWLLMDVHLAPQVALRAASRFAAMYKGSLLGAALTLKLNDWAFLERLEQFMAAASELGIVAPQARQLPAHRQEIALAGLTARGRQWRP